MQSNELLNLTIHDEATLKEVSHLLHDAVFSANSWSYDEKNRCFHLKLWREVPDSYKHEKLFLCVCRISFKREACQLTVRQVDRVTVRVRDELDCYSLFHIRYLRDRGLLVFETEGTISVEVSTEHLDCQLCDVGESTWKQYGYWFLSWGKKGR